MQRIYLLRPAASKISRLSKPFCVSKSSPDTKNVNLNEALFIEGTESGVSDALQMKKIVNRSLILENLGCRSLSNLQFEIDDMFLRDFDSNERADNFIRKRLQECDPKSFSILVRSAGWESRNESFTALRENLPAIASRLRMISSSNTWSMEDVTHVICGMEFMREEHPAVLEILSLMTTIATAQLQRGHRVTPVNIRIFCKGLRNMHCKEAESKNLVNILRTMIECCDHSLKSPTVFSILLGMQRMGYNSPEVITILTAMVDKVVPLVDTKTAKEMAASLHGLQIRNMHSPQLNAVLYALDPLSQCNTNLKLPRMQIENLFSTANHLDAQRNVDAFIKGRLHECGLDNISNLVRLAGRESRDESFTALRDNLPLIASRLQMMSSSNSWHFRNISMIIFGLQSMGETEPGVSDIISLMSSLATSQLAKGTVFAPEDIATMLLGLQNMQCHTVHTIKLLSIATTMVENCPHFGDSTIGNSFYALQHMSSDNIIVRGLVEALTAKLKNTNLILSAHSMSLIIFGLRNMDSECTEVYAAMEALTFKAGTLTGQLTSDDISLILIGLRNRSSYAPEVCELLKVVAFMIRESTCPLGAHAIRLMNGLNNMTSDSEELLELVEALVPKIIDCGEVLGPEDVGDALYGMQGLNSDVPSVRLLLAAFIPLVRGCKGTFTEMNVSMSLYGLRSMSSYTPEVCELIGALVPKIRLCPESLTPLGIGNSLYGLQGILNNSPEVYALLNALLPKIANCKEELQPRYIGSALYGLRRMDSNLPGVCEIVWCLSSKVRSCRGIFNAQNMANSLFGLQRMGNNSADVRNLMSALTVKMASCTDIFDGQALSNSLFGLKSMNCDDLEVRNMLSALLPKVDSCIEALNEFQMGLSLKGLQNMDPDQPEVAALLRSLGEMSLKAQNYESREIKSVPQRDDETLYKLLDDTIDDQDLL